MRGIRRLMLLFTLGVALLAGGIGAVAGSFTDSEDSPANTFQAWISTQWLQTIRADFEAGILTRVDTRNSTDNVVLARDSRIFAFQGGTASFWAYGIPGNAWTPMTNALNTTGTGAALAYNGSRYIYAFRGGGNNRTFWRYDTTLGTWQARANAPANVGAGGALAYDASGYVYALRGNATNAFWRYNITGNTWAVMANTPANVAAGGALANDGTGYIYALRGSNRTAFWRYDIANNSWATMASTPANVGAGGALAYDGAGYIYAFRGNNRTAFWRYDIANNSWAVMATTPATVGAGGALSSAGSGYIYGFRGGNTTAFWRYDALGNSWMTMANAPGNVAAGGSLSYVGASAFVSSGTLASQVRDTGTVGAGWDALFWDETLPLNTDISFEVRANDTPFTADDVTLPWTLVGGTSPVTSGLPSGRYMQWRATLTTTDITVTPLLHEVRVYHC